MEDNSHYKIYMTSSIGSWIEVNAAMIEVMFVLCNLAGAKA